MENETVQPVDIIAMMMLKDFIKDRYPNADPRSQVAAAYLYAGLLVECKKANDQQQPTLPSEEEMKAPTCTKCNIPFNIIDISTLDSPGAAMLVCPSCGSKKYGDES